MSLLYTHMYTYTNTCTRTPRINVIEVAFKFHFTHTMKNYTMEKSTTDMIQPSCGRMLFLSHYSSLLAYTAVDHRFRYLVHSGGVAHEVAYQTKGLEGEKIVSLFEMKQNITGYRTSTSNPWCKYKLRPTVHDDC